MFEKLCNVIANQVEVDPEKITPQTRIKEDLYVDSLDMVDIAMTVENTFGGRISDELLEQIAQCRV